MSGSKLRILVISNLYPPFHGGGYGLHCYWYCRALAQRGHQVEVVTGNPPPSLTESRAGNFELPGVMVRRDLSFMEGRLSAPQTVRATLRNHYAVKQAIRRFVPDIVFCHGIDGISYEAYHAGNEGGVPSISMLGDTWLAQAWRDLPNFDPWNALAAGRSSSRAVGAAKRLLGSMGRLAGLYTGVRPRRFYPTLVISSYLLNDLQEARAPLAGLAKLFAPILDARFFDGDAPIGRLGERSSQLRCLFVSRMELLKGPDVAIEGVAEAVRRGADVTLTMAGLPPSKTADEFLRHLVQEQGIADRCRWAGSPDDSELMNLYRTHDVFLFPSRIKEGFGLVNAEAMACGLPVVGTVSSGPADLIIENETGCPIPDNDSQAMASRLVHLHRNPDVLEALSRGAGEAVRRLHPAAVTDRLERSIHEAIEIFQGKRAAFG